MSYLISLNVISKLIQEFPFGFFLNILIFIFIYNLKKFTIYKYKLNYIEISIKIFILYINIILL